MSSSHESPAGVAIIGMSARFPGAADVEQLWRNLRDGVESVRRLSDEELDRLALDPRLRERPEHVPAVASIDGIELFDADFFDVTPREAELTDPQHRLFLECAWEAFENASLVPGEGGAAVGVFAGAGHNHYLLSHLVPNQARLRVSPVEINLSADNDYLATRVSYKLNLRGPSLSVQTACSTGLVAVHLACQSLLDLECDLALAGAVALRMPDQGGYLYRKGDILSPDGHCRPFDARAEGTLFGSGVAAVVLKRLEDALEDRDPIQAVILGSAVNNDGALKVGYTAPGIEGQSQVVAEALSVAGVEPEDVTYVEAHGTGTALGDPIEVAALTRAFRSGTDRVGYCALGSVKSNLGHLNAAAGMAGLMKSVLALRHGMLPPSLHYESPNPQIDFASSPFFVNSELSPWPAGGSPRRCGVSSFGIGGTNAHAVLQEAPRPAPSGAGRPLQLLPVAATRQESLDAASTRLAEHLEGRDVSLADAAYTLSVGRKAFPWRRALVCADRAEAARVLGGAEPERWISDLARDGGREVVFMFPGQGAQRAGMGWELAREEPIYRRYLDRCAEELRPVLGLDLRELLDEAAAGDESAAAHLEETALTQPVLFSVEYALARLFMEWGVRPRAMIGHSVGEIVAACLAGVLSLPDALALAAARGRLMQEMREGAMLAVSLAAAELAGRLDGEIEVAAINGPRLTVVSGPPAAIEALAERLQAERVSCQRLRTRHAFHSVAVEAVLEPLAAELARIDLQAPTIPYLSNVSGTWITEAEATDPAYWTRHARQAVRFADGARELLGRGDVLLEVGPGKALSSFVRQQPGFGDDERAITTLATAAGASDHRAALEALGRLWMSGAEVDWAAFYADQDRARVALPSYPFERRRFWVEAPAPGEQAVAAREPSEEPRLEPADWFSVPSWRRRPVASPSDPEPEGWLVLTFKDGLSQQVLEALRRRGATPVTARPGAGFERLADGAYSLDPASLEDHEALLRAVVAEHGTPRRIVHLWTLRPVDDSASREALPQQRALGFGSLVALAQALGRLGVRDDVAIEVASSGVWEVTGEEALVPARALLSGPAKVIPQEYPNVTCRLIDVELPVAGSPRETAVAARLVDEILSPQGGAETALRGRHRWNRFFEPVHLEASTETVGLRDRGVYLITGGFGGLGRTFARHLAETVAARLILVGRSPLPPREEWDSAAAGDPAERIRHVRQLEAAGAEVMVATADVTDPVAMRAVVERARQRFGALHGVLHSAGVAGGGIIQRQTAESLERVLAPKVDGSLVLHEVLRDAELDFLLLFSSTFALSGGAGRVEYVAANAFLDAFAHLPAGRRGPALAIDWYGWEDVGMAAGVLAGSATAGAMTPAGTEVDHPLIDRRGPAEDGESEVFSTLFDVGRHWVLSEHRLGGRHVVPGTAYLEMARAAFAERTGERAVEIRDATFFTPLVVDEATPCEVRTVLSEEEPGVATFRVQSRAEGASPWRDHARGLCVALGGEEAPPVVELEPLRRRLAGSEIEVRPFGSGGQVEVGPRWNCLRRAFVGDDGEALAILELPEEHAADLDAFALHPALLDVATGSSLGLVQHDGQYLPLSYRRLRCWRPLPREVRVHVRPTEKAQGRETLSLDLVVTDSAGRVLVEVEGYTAKRVSGGLASASSTAPVRKRRGIAPREGLDALGRLLAAPALGHQVVVSPRPLARVIDEQNVIASSSRQDGGAAPTASVARHARPALSTPFTAPRNPMESAVAEVWAELLGVEGVGIHDNFFELGGQSLLAVELGWRLRELFQVELPVDQLFEGATVAKVAQAIAQQVAESIEGEDLSEVLRDLEELSDEDLDALAMAEAGNEETVNE